MAEEHTTAGGQPIEEALIEARETQRQSANDGRWIRLYDHFKREWQIYVMLLPTIIWFLVFLYKPMYGLQIAFKDYSIFKGVANSPWIGWEHFQTLFDNDSFIRAVRFRPIFVGTGIWQEAGFGSIVFLAAIAGVNPSLYESAVVDGANRWQMMWKITIPSIMPTILIMLIIRIGNVMEVSFELVILLYQPSTYSTADVVNTWVYRQGLQSGQYDLAAAAGLFNAVVAFVLVMTANTLSRRFSRTSLW